MEGRDVALEGAVRLDRDKAAPGAQALALRLDDRDMAGIQLRHDHRDVVGAAVGGIVGDDRDLRLRVGFLEGLDLVFGHIDRTEDEIDQLLHFFNILRRVEQDHVGHRGGQRGLHQPAARHEFPVLFPGAPLGGGEGGDMKPGMVFEQGGEPLPDHAGGPDNSNTIVFHLKLHPLPVVASFQYMPPIAAVV